MSWVAVGLGGCIASPAEQVQGGGTSDAPMSCVDRDGDGYGSGCLSGLDCDDHDPTVHRDCVRCALPEAHCPCDEGAQPVSCFLARTQDAAGTLMCHEGTRYCREGTWSACESVHSYPLPERAPSSLIDPDAGPVRCNDCAVNCFRISDTLDPVDGGLSNSGANVGWAEGGGLTLGQLPDAGTTDTTIVAPYVPPDCTLGVGVDPDCDGIPNPYDAYPDDKPFATNNTALFFDIGPGQTGRGAIDLQFYLNSADLYFLVDQSNSMSGERDRLKADLTTGDFVLDSAFACADYDFDGQPNDELKDQGIIGAIRCIIRDADFGVGFFREIPFYPYVFAEQAADHLAYWNYHDISPDVDSVLAAVNRLQTVGNRDWPEASMLALHTVLTGSGMYFGVDRRGIPPREDCPMERWGYPCFREGAIPIVVMFTDAQFHNGPNDNAYAYDSNRLDITAGTDERYYPVANTNEDFASVVDLGDVTGVFKTFTGDTSDMRADLPASVFSCLSDSDGNDAAFMFEVTQRREVTIETTGSQFDSVLGVYTGIPGTPDDLPQSDGGNETGAAAYDFGDIYDRYLRMTGSTAGMDADYQWSDVGCNAAGASADAVFQFDLSTPARVALDASGSGFDTVLSLYSAEPGLPPTYSAMANTNEDHASAHDLGDVYGQVRAVSGSTLGLTANYSAGQVGCNADNGASDAVYTFDVTQPTRVRLSSEGSAYDTVLALFDSSANPIGTAQVPPINEVQSTAYAVGTLDDRIFALTGSTATMAADIGRTPVGCNSNDYAPDAVFEFSLTEPTDVQIDTIGTGWDTVISLHDQLVDANTTYLQATNTNEAFATATDLGTLNSREVRVLGASTSGMDDDYDSLFSRQYVSCTGLLGPYSPDAAYRFSLDTDTLVRIDMAGSSFDTVLSLHGAAPVEPISTVPDTNEAQATAFDVGAINGRSFQHTGDTSGMAHDYYVGCGAEPATRDAVYTFSLTSQTDVHIDTDDSSFDTVLGLYPSTISVEPTPVEVGNAHGTLASAYDMGSLDGRWRTFVGDTFGAGANHWENRCNSDWAADDAYFRFSLASGRNVTITSAGSSFDTVLMLYRQSGSNWNHVECEHSNWGDETITRNLGAGDYVLVIKGDRSNDEGPYELSFKDDSGAGEPNQISCDDDGGSVGASSAITRTLDAGTYHLVISGKTASSSGAYTVRFRDDSWLDQSFGEIECNDDGGPGTSSLIERQLTAGSYLLLVKGNTSVSSGPYALRVVDVNPPPEAIPAITCDDDSGGAGTSRIVRNDLPAGNYWVVLKGDADDDAGSYTLNIRDLEATGSGTMLACDDDGGDGQTSVIERNLDPGSYQVIVKGDGASDAGDYALSLRDVTHRPFNRIACDDDSGADATSYIEENLAAGSYYAVLKGGQPTSGGPYTLSVRDVTHRPLSSTFCDDNGSLQSSNSGSIAPTPASPHLTSRIVQTFDPGTYYAVVKGKNASASGPYQLSIGSGDTSAAKYGPPTWSDTLAAVQDSGARVISILSCHDDPDYGDDDGDCVQARAQAQALASASGALGENLQPLVFDIAGSGEGLSRTLVNAIAELAEYLEMNVKLRVAFEPDDNPGFAVTVRAIDAPSDGCSGLFGIEHRSCRPGATPQFEIDIENPLGSPVPDNPDDPNGGYQFLAELIGNDQFVIDSIPIYVIPRNVLPDMGPPEPTHHTEGQYWQDVSSSACAGNRAPDWRDLGWNADVHAGTSVTFSACTAQDAAGLQTCVPREIATVTGGESCGGPEDCALGYCDADIGVCQIARAGNCTSSSECASNAFCDTTAGKCTYESQPVYIGAALGEGNFKSFIRMVIGLSAETGFEQPPVVHSWDMTYHCNNVL